MGKPLSDRIHALELRRAQLVARIQKLEAQDRERQRREDTRRKILAGAMVLDAALEDEWLLETLSRRLHRSADRALFRLDAPSAPSADAESQLGSTEDPAARL